MISGELKMGDLDNDGPKNARTNSRACKCQTDLTSAMLAIRSTTPYTNTSSLTHLLCVVLDHVLVKLSSDKNSMVLKFFPKISYISSNGTQLPGPSRTALRPMAGRKWTRGEGSETEKRWRNKARKGKWKMEKLWGRFRDP